MSEPKNSSDKASSVFVIYGRNREASRAVFSFLRALGLQPMEWEQAVAKTTSSTPYPGEVLDAAMEAAQAIVVLFTPDEYVALRSEYSDDAADQATAVQARPNVIFEAGMAMAKYSNRTILVQFGPHRNISDIDGRHMVRLEDTSEKRNQLATRLSEAGCAVDRSGSDWISEGKLSPPTAGEPPVLAETKLVDSPGAAEPSPDQRRIEEDGFCIIASPPRKNFGNWSLIAIAHNNGPTRGAVSVTATFYGAVGSTLLGTATGMSPEIDPKKQKTFELNSMDDLGGFQQWHVQIDQIF